MNELEFDAFLARSTRLRPVILVPEIALHQADDLAELWAEQEAASGRPGSATPYWCVAWPGGQALARFLLDQPAIVAGRRVLDVGSGSGLCAIAAARAGAREVTAADIDADACRAIGRNASANGVTLRTSRDDPVGRETAADVVLAADLWYEPFLARRVTPWLRGLAARGCEVLVADPGRAHAPRRDLAELASHELAPAPGPEPGESMRVRVFRLLPANAAPPPCA